MSMKQIYYYIRKFPKYKFFKVETSTQRKIPSGTQISFRIDVSTLKNFY